MRTTTPYSMLLIETGCLPIEYHVLIHTLWYIQKVRNMHNDRLPRQGWEMCKKPRKNYKSKFLALGWMLDIWKWFASHCGHGHGATCGIHAKGTKAFATPTSKDCMMGSKPKETKDA